MNSTAAPTLISAGTNDNQEKPRLSLAPAESEPLRSHVSRSLNEHFRNLDGEPVSDLYALVLAEMEIPLLEKVLEYTRGNQTRAAEMLGLNRGTLRKKLKQYGLL